MIDHLKVMVTVTSYGLDGAVKSNDSQYKESFLLVCLFVRREWKWEWAAEM
jgi:hypothetical protein